LRGGIRILRDALGCEHIGISYIRFGSEWRLTLGHCHPVAEEVYALVERRARIKGEDEIYEMMVPVCEPSSRRATSSGRFAPKVRPQSPAELTRPRAVGCRVESRGLSREG
jgi:hypothetical protein